MIHIQITNSPDLNVLSDFHFFQNEIYIGRSAGNLHINDQSLLKSHIMIEVLDKDLIIHPQKGVEFYLIDGKRSSTVRKLRPEQVISIGQTTIKILKFEDTHSQSKKDLLDTKLASLIESESPRLLVIEKLAQLMK
jgi:hypothetical protein